MAEFQRIQARTLAARLAEPRRHLHVVAGPRQVGKTTLVQQVLTVAEDGERLARFDREAKVLASLNHPNIAGIYGFHDHAGVRFLAMELVPGEDLAERLRRGPLPVAEALEVARQIAEALEAAHEQGVIHRDLKPANIRITQDGKVKVLDFGLAKALEKATGGGDGRDPGMSPTITSLGTVAGVILGTAAYMSPEQARGKPVDKRADIWAFGCVLFELLTGTRPFDGETISDTLAAVLARDADWSLLPAGKPEKVRDLLQRCLEKDPKRRLRDIGDARLELDEALAARTASGRVRVTAEPVVAPPVRRRVAGTVVVVALAAALLGAAVAWWAMAQRGVGPAGRVVRLDLQLPDEVRFNDFALSPDGRSLLILGSPRVAAGVPELPRRAYVRPLDRTTLTALGGLEDVRNAGFSADGRSIVAAVPTTKGSPQTSLVRVPVDGSAPPLTLIAADPRWATGCVLHNGEFVVLQGGTELVRVRSGEALPPVKVDLAGEKGALRFAAFALPGDKGVLLHAIAYSAKGWYYRVGVLDFETARITYLFDDGGFPVYSPTGHILFTRGDTLLAVGFDPEARKLTGAPVPLTDGLRAEYSFTPTFFQLSDDGTLVYTPGGKTAESRRVGVLDTQGTVTPIGDEAHAYQGVRAGSADGKRFLATITNGQGIDELWLGEFDHPGLRRLLAIPGADVFTPILSRDGQRVAFGRKGRGAEDGIYVMSLDDAAPARRLARLPVEDSRTNLGSWMPDGSAILANRRGADQKCDIVFIPVLARGEGSEEPKALLSGLGDEENPAVSPDGRWLAYDSDESGRPEIYVAALGPGPTVRNPRRATSSGGVVPYWTPDGRQIRYRESAQGRVMTLPVTTAPTLSFGVPTVVSDPGKQGFYIADPLPDGRQLVLIRGEGETDEVQRLAVVLHFSQELKAKLAAR
jgi:serine/threonine-protein kinase